MFVCTFRAKVTEKLHRTKIYLNKETSPLFLSLLSKTVKKNLNFFNNTLYILRTRQFKIKVMVALTIITIQENLIEVLLASYNLCIKVYESSLCVRWHRLFHCTLYYY